MILCDIDNFKLIEPINKAEEKYFNQINYKKLKVQFSNFVKSLTRHDLNHIDNLAYPNTNLNKDILNYVKRFNLSKIYNREYKNENVIKTLSGGEQKRIALIRGMSKKADVYIFDEPTNDLDSENVNTVIQEIIKLKDNAMVVIISHDKRVMDIADKVIKLN